MGLYRLGCGSLMRFQSEYQNKLGKYQVTLLPPERTYSSLQIGKFPFAYRGLKIIPDFQRWKHYNDIYQEKKIALEQLKKEFSGLDKNIRSLQLDLADLDISVDSKNTYFKFLGSFQDLQFTANQLTSQFSLALPEAPLLQTYKQFSAGISPTLAMWLIFHCLPLSVQQWLIFSQYYFLIA
jgi:hypothetical protein